jgi:EmrB/QacA subfamily drug resistance transporter
MISTNAADAPVALSAADMRAATFAVMLTMALSAIDQTIVSVAVPTIARQLGDAGWSAWVISGYLIASTVVTPLYGKLADSYGRRQVMLGAILLFVVSSALCALARSLPELVIARLLQGAGGGGLIVLAQAVVADIVPMRERGRMQGNISMVWAAAGLLGPLVGGVITQWLSWPWIFWINLPAGLLAFLLVHRSLASLPAQKRQVEVDWAGAVLLLASLSALLLPITRMGQGVPLLDAHNLLGLGAAVLLMAVFWRRERRSRSPMLPVTLLGERSLMLGCTMLFTCFFMVIALSVLVPMRLQLVEGLPAAHSAVLMLPLTLGTPFAVFWGGRWLLRHPRIRPLQRLGSLLMFAGLLALALIPPSHHLASLVALGMTGVGVGLQMPTTLLMVQNQVPRPQVGMATALTVFFRLLGGAMGIAVLGAIVFASIGAAAFDAVASGGALQPTPADDAGFRTALLAAAALSIINIACGRYLPDVHLHGKAELVQAMASEA